MSEPCGAPPCVVRTRPLSEMLELSSDQCDRARLVTFVVHCLACYSKEATHVTFTNWQGLKLCRRHQGTEDEMWSLASGDCLLEDGCLSSPNFPSWVPFASPCEVAINPEWTGVLHVEYGYSLRNSFFIDGEEVPLDVALHNLDGMEPRSTLVWSGSQYPKPWKDMPGGSCSSMEGHDRTVPH